MKMLKSSLAFTRILVKNSFSLNINTSKVWQSSAIQTYRCRYVSDDGRQLTIANTKQPQGDERKRKIVEAEVIKFALFGVNFFFFNLIHLNWR